MKTKKKIPKLLLYSLLTIPILIASKTDVLAWSCPLPIQYTSTSYDASFSAIDVSGMDTSQIVEGGANTTSNNKDLTQYGGNYHNPTPVESTYVQAGLQGILDCTYTGHCGGQDAGLGCTCDRHMHKVVDGYNTYSYTDPETGKIAYGQEEISHMEYDHNCGTMTCEITCPGHLIQYSQMFYDNAGGGKHVYNWYVARYMAPTCTNEGYIKYQNWRYYQCQHYPSSCSINGYITFSAGFKLGALGHNSKTTWEYKVNDIDDITFVDGINVNNGHTVKNPTEDVITGNEVDLYTNATDGDPIVTRVKRCTRSCCAGEAADSGYRILYQQWLKGGVDITSTKYSDDRLLMNSGSSTIAINKAVGASQPYAIDSELDYPNIGYADSDGDYAKLGINGPLGVPDSWYMGHGYKASSTAASTTINYLNLESMQNLWTNEASVGISATNEANNWTINEGVANAQDNSVSSSGAITDVFEGTVSTVGNTLTEEGHHVLHNNVTSSGCEETSYSNDVAEHL